MCGYVASNRSDGRSVRGKGQGRAGVQRRARYVGGRQVDQRDVQHGCDRLHLRPGPGAGHRGDPPEGTQDRRDRSGRRGRAQPVRRLLRVSVAGGRRPLRGEVSAGDGPRAPLDCPAHGPRRAGAWRHGRRPRLHRQGERPGPVRRDVPDARARPQDHRPGARVEVDADPGARIRRQARHRGRGDQEVDLQHRPEPVGPLDRGRHPRRPLGRASARHLSVDRRPPAGA